MDLTDIKPTIIDSEESLNILPKPRSFTFDNPAMVRRLLYEYNRFYYMNLSCILPKPRSFTFDNPAMVRRLLYEHNWFYYMNLSCILPEPRSFTFDNPAMIRRLLYEYNWFYYMNLSCIFYAVNYQPLVKWLFSTSVCFFYAP